MKELPWVALIIYFAIWSDYCSPVAWAEWNPHKCACRWIYNVHQCFNPLCKPLWTHLHSNYMQIWLKRSFYVAASMHQDIGLTCGWNCGGNEPKSPPKRTVTLRQTDLRCNSWCTQNRFSLPNKATSDSHRTPWISTWIRYFLENWRKILQPVDQTDFQTLACSLVSILMGRLIFSVCKSQMCVSNCGVTDPTDPKEHQQ